VTRWRLILVWTLLVLPWLVIVGLGGFAMWRMGWSQWVWVPILICWGSALLMLRLWQTKWQFIRTPAAKAVPHWTPRDRDAWQVVEDKAKSVENLPADALLRPQFYFDTALDMATRIAAVYHPKAEDPVENLTVPEILAALELAFEDLSALVDQYVPAGHLLTIKHWRRVAQIPKWYDRFAKVYWPVSAVLAPATVIARYATSKLVISPITESIQENLLGWFYVSFVHRLGYYIVELNSGRLAGGSARFREMMDRMNEDFDPTGAPRPRRPGTPSVTERAEAEASADAADAKEDGRGERTEITICLIGQSKAGKSSLINALLGENKAVVDVVPATDSVTRYQLHRQETNDHLALLDTVGYATEGFTATQKRETEEALKRSDLVLLVMDASSPARATDAQTLENLHEWFRTRRDLRPVPVLGVLTHVDLLRPVREWEPPYDWQSGSRPKERSIREAVAYTRGLFGEKVAGIVPVCTDAENDRVFGVEEFLIPAMTPLLGNARATALLRSLHAAISSNKARRVVNQLWEVGKTLLKAGVSGSRQ
jgi:predicted GTPase